MGACRRDEYTILCVYDEYLVWVVVAVLRVRIGSAATV